LFLRDGYLATSMDQIAAAASVSKQTVYKQFADKQSLVMSTPLNRVMLCGDAELPAQADLDRYADAGARAFLAAYGAR
jgi:TetR/AcrR family transcriptional repressor of mexJK operon